MDGLTVAASIAGLVSLADSIFRTTVRYVKRAKGARHEVDDLLNEVKNFSILLHELSLIASELESPPSVDDPLPRPPANMKLHYLHDCQQLLIRLDRGLADLKKDIESSSALNRLQGHMKWPFKSTETQEIVQSIRHQKQIIHLALSADSFHKLNQLLSRQDDVSKRLNALQATVNDIRDIDTKIILNQARREVLDFFTKEANPRPEFETNRDLRHPLTGLWFTESLDFREWYSNPGSKMWISGIPGAGKSVLATLIIMQCLQLSSASSRVASAYFFCSYKDEKTHLAKNILSSLASQIAMQNEAAFDILQEYHQELRSHKQLPGDPTSDRLLEILAKMSIHFDQIFIIVDGLDECDIHTDDVVWKLLNLSTSQAYGIITMALLSRDELSIRLQLEPKFAIIDIEAKTEDIQLYVASELENRTSSKRLRLRDLSLKDQIMTQLVDGAKGMFRWVACQLDHLCELPTDRARREALTKLPPTLPASYERILLRVESSTYQVQKIVQKSLQLIAVGSRRNSLGIQQICEAVSVSIDQDTFEDDEIVNAEEIIKWCSSLIRRSTDCRRFEFAHYSVMEFLEGIHSTHPNLHSYHASIGKGISLLAPICLRYLTFKNHEKATTATQPEIQRMRERNIARPFYEFAAMWWPVFFWGGQDDGAVTNRELLYTLFDIRKTESFTSWALEFVRHCIWHENQLYYYERDDFGRDEHTTLTIISAVVRPDFTPLHMAAALGLFSVCEHLLEQGARIDVSSRFGTPLHCALGGINVFTDADSFIPLTADLEVLVPATPRIRTTQILLAAKANTSLYFVTPFKQGTILSLKVQSSGFGEDFEVVVSLIRAGVELEVGDLAAFDKYYEGAIKKFSPEDFKSKISGGKAIMSLLEALGTLGNNDSSLRSQLFTSTCKFAKKMELSLDNSLSNILPKGWATKDVLGNCVLSTIEDNDITIMERLIESGRLDFIKAFRLFSNDDRNGWSVLHVCIASRSIDVLKLLLECGCDPDVQVIDKGLTPVHLCNQDKDQDMLRALMEHGASTTMQDIDMNTIWHLCASTKSSQVVETLVALDKNKDTALRMQNKEGRTPICESLAKINGNNVRLLLPHCTSKEYWKGDMPFFRRAAEIGSVDIVQALQGLKIPLDVPDPDIGSPLHSLGIHATIECTKLLIELFPHCHMKCEKGRTPFESVLLRCIENDYDACPDNLLELLSTFEGPEWERRGELWPSICSVIVPYAISTEHDIRWLERLLFGVFKTGVVKGYEEEHLVSALVPLADELESIGNMAAVKINKYINKDLKPQKFLVWYPHTVNNWPWLSRVLIEIITTSSYWNSVLTHPSIIKALSWAITQDDSNVIKLLLERGADVHNQADELSPLELACMPAVAISEDNFACLLSSALPHKLNVTNQNILGLGIVHLTGIFPSEDRGLWKLKQIVDAGADCNIRSSDRWETPALIFHISQRSLKTSAALIDRGANPWPAVLAADHNVALTAVQMRNSAILKKIKQATLERNLVPMWDRTWSGWVGERFFSGGNAIHLAAARGALECLEFFVDEGLIRDLEHLDDDMQTPMHYAAYRGSRDAINFLRDHGCNVSAEGRNGIMPLHLAIQSKKIAAIQQLLNMGSETKACSFGMTPLAYAYQGGNDDIIRLLRSYGGQHDVSSSTTLGKGTPILMGALSTAIAQNDIRACEDLKSQGCPVDLELTTPWQVTPLMMALCETSEPEVIEWLVNNGANTTAEFSREPQPPHTTILEAAISSSMYNGLLPMLLTRYFEQGGDLLHHPRSPLHIAVQYENHEGLTILLSELRRKHGIADTLQPHQFMTTSGSNFRALLDQPDQTDYNQTTLHKAASLDSIEDVESLLASAANVNLTDNDGSTPLHLAAWNGSERIIELLLKHDAWLERLDNTGSTPLMDACRSGHFNSVKILIDHGEPSIRADIFGKNLLNILLYKEDESPCDVRMWELLCNRGIDPYEADSFGISAIHRILARPSQGLLRHIIRQGHITQLAARVEWAVSQLATLDGGMQSNVNSIASSYRLIRRYAGSNRSLRISTSVTVGEGSLFYMAASLGFVRALDDILTIGADPEQEFGHHGTPLTLSATNGHLEAVKYLFRRKPWLVSKQNEVISSAVSGALRQEDIVRWFLVERHIDQRKIAPCELETDQEDVQLRHWSGIQCLAVPLRWEWKQRRDESMMEYVERRWEIVQSLQGRVVE